MVKDNFPKFAAIISHDPGHFLKKALYMGERTSFLNKKYFGEMHHERELVILNHNVSGLSMTTLNNNCILYLYQNKIIINPKNYSFSNTVSR